MCTFRLFVLTFVIKLVAIASFLLIHRVDRPWALILEPSPTQSFPNLVDTLTMLQGVYEVAYQSSSIWSSLYLAEDFAGQWNHL